MSKTKNIHIVVTWKGPGVLIYSDLHMSDMSDMWGLTQLAA